MNLFRPIYRHPFVWLAGLVLAAVMLWIGYFLATFDLDHYREQVASEIGNRLQMPVRLGEAHLELREAGVAFSFNELQIGNEQTSAELHAQKVWLQLAWHGLLLNKPILTEVALSSPRLRLSPTTTAAPNDTPPANSFDLDLLQGLHIQRVEVSKGSLDVSWLDPAGVSRTFSLGDLSIELDNFGLARSVVFNADGNLLRHSEQARLAVKGSVDLPAAGNWRDATWDIALEAKTLEAARLAELLPERTGIRAEGQVDLSVYLKGTLGDTLTAQAEVGGQQLRIRPGSAYRQPIPLKHLQLAGTWQSQDGNHQLRQLAVQFDDLRLSGEIAVNSTADAHSINGSLGNCTLPVDTLRRWLPDDLLTDQPLLGKMQPGGLLTIRQASFNAELAATPEGHSTLTLEGAEGEISKLAWAIDEARSAELAALTFQLRDGRWQLDHGSATVAGWPIAFSGTVVQQAGSPAQVGIELASHPSAEQVVGLLRENLPADLTLAGALALQGRLTGTIEQMQVDARLDLAQLDVRYAEQVHLPPTPGAAFTLQGQATRTALTIEQGSLNLPPLNGRMMGAIDWTGPLMVDLTTRLELPDLAASYEVVPAIGKLRLQGGAAVDLTMSGPVASAKPRVSIELHDVGIPMHGFVADISQLNGRLLLEGKGIHSETLAAHLGKSPTTLQVRVADLTAPRLELGVKAAAIRADELIFRSDRTMLRDLSGQLLIDRDGIAFAPVRVRLDGGTQAVVSGSLKNYDAPTVDLAIAGEYADVKEIIGLWTDESPAAAALRKSRHAGVPGKPLPPIRIEVDAENGDLYGMKFAKAKALIVPTTEQLLIHPLDFSIGAGYCTAQVLVDHAGAETVLRVSGHAENVDAYAIYHELLRRKSILRGTLRGDFYLQGSLGGDRFLPTSFGNVVMEVRDGIFRQSPVLSSIFSLLNVSQLFSFQLPELSSEGMPFSLLTAELAIEKGTISTENLVINSNSMNMSYVGKYDLIDDQLDLIVVIKPLGTIDKVVTRLPIAGWILGGEEKALITAQLKVTGPAENPKVEAIPVTAISKGVLGIFQRTLGLPLRLIDDPAILWGGGGEKKN